MTDLARVVVGDPAAPTLLLLHGVTSSAVGHAGAIRHWAERGYRVVALDARGHGLSPRWAASGATANGMRLVEDAAAVLEELRTEAQGREALGLPTCGAPVVIGHSMGGATALVLAGRRPDLVRGVVLEDPARYRERSAQEVRDSGARRDAGRAAAAQDPATVVAQRLQDPAYTAETALASVWSEARTDPDHLAADVIFPEVPWHEALAALAETGLPVLVVSGDGPGTIIDAQGLAEIDALGNPRVQGVLVPGAGHSVRRERPVEYYAAVDAWLERVLPVGETARGAPS